MKLRPQSPGNEYLRYNLLPLIDSIVPKNTSSSILSACGLGDTTSSQSILITCGNRFEKFWNKVITHSRGVDNQLPFANGTDRIKVDTKDRQVDHFFSIHDLENNNYVYLESKTNLDFDTEKKPESNEKIKRVGEQLGFAFDATVNCGYYVPVEREIDQKVRSHYTKHGVNVYGVEDMFRWLNDVPFTIDEYFIFLRDVIGPVLKEKLDGVPVQQPAHSGRHSDLDAL